MKQRTKPRVLLTTRSYRIVQRPHGGISLEVRAGVDSMRNQIWHHVDSPTWVHLREIGTALGRRLDRQRKAARRRGPQCN